MNWDKSFEALMRELGAEPYGCQRLGCTHVSGGFYRMLWHDKFGIHDSEGVSS